MAKNKYNNILDTAKDLFWKHGFKRVSVEEICRKANVSKMTYYKHFPNKIELAKTVYNNEMKKGTLKFRNIMEADIDPAEKIKKLILLKVEGTNNISKEFLADFFTSSEPELKKFVEERTKISWNEILNDFKKAQQTGWIRKDIRPEFLIHISLKAADIITDPELLKLYDNPQDLIIEYVNFAFYGMSPRG